LAPPLSAFGAAKAAVAPIMEVINRKPLIDGFSDAGEKPTEATKGRIALEDIEFAYPSRPEITVCKVRSMSVCTVE
jgi:ATP-binding cassette subfamily B (MDR/TAP) protein 1